jgi:hypothetical protein
MFWLLVTANIVPSSPILVTMMMEVIPSSETLVLARATWHNIPEDGILHSHCRENPNRTLSDILNQLEMESIIFKLEILSCTMSCTYFHCFHPHI